MAMMRQGLAPIERAASMYSFSLMDSVWPRTIREMPAQEKNVMTPITTGRLGPSTTASASAEHDVGEGEHGVDEPGQHRVDPAAEVAGGHGRWSPRPRWPSRW